MLSFVIWGCGYRGKMLLNCLEKSRVKAYIDTNPELQGGFYKGVPIISFQSYLKEYKANFIIVSPFITHEIVRFMDCNGISNYFILDRCPGELLPHYENILPFKEMLAPIQTSFDGHRVIIAGINLFSILLYDFLQKSYNVFLLYLDCKYRFTSELKKQKYNFVLEDDILDTDQIIVTEKNLYKKIRHYKFGCIPFFRFPYLRRFNYEPIKRFFNVHSDKRCFVVATGPSVRIHDLNRLYENNEYSISVNMVYKSFHLTKWRPNYLVVSDTATLDIYRDEIIDSDVKYKFVTDRQYGLWKDINRRDVVLFHLIEEDYGEEGPEFSSRLDIGAFYGYTVLYCALQLAVYMGFSEIYIIGADCEYKCDGLSPEDHFVPGYAHRGGAMGDLNVEKMFPAYERAREYADENGIRIFNATRGGKLEVFERVDFDTLFSDRAKGDKRSE